MVMVTVANVRLRGRTCRTGLVPPLKHLGFLDGARIRLQSVDNTPDGCSKSLIEAPPFCL